MGRTGIFASSMPTVVPPDIWFDAQDTTTMSPAPTGNGSVVTVWSSKGSVANFTMNQTAGTATYRTNWFGAGHSGLQFGAFKGTFSNGGIPGHRWETGVRCQPRPRPR